MISLTHPLNSQPLNLFTPSRSMRAGDSHHLSFNAPRRRPHLPFLLLVRANPVYEAIYQKKRISV